METPKGMETDSKHGVWVRYFTRSRQGGNSWMMDDDYFFVLFEDINQKIQEPDLSVVGLRFYYKF